MNRCVSCGNTIFKSAKQDPYMCRVCEVNIGLDIEKYWLDV